MSDTDQKKMRKTKITSFDKEGVRSGRSLEAVLSELGLDHKGDEFQEGNFGSKEREEDTGVGNANENDTNTDEEELVLHICRLSFTTLEKSRTMGLLIRSRRWTKIVFEKTSGRFVSLVLQDSVLSTRVLQVKQHQRYDGIKWNFGLDWFPDGLCNDSDGSCCPRLEEVYLTGVRFRSGDELAFLNSLSDGLARVAATTATNSIEHTPIGLRVLELNACRFLHPDVQYPILFRGLRVACFGTLERLWMPKSPGLDDDRFEELFGNVLLARDEGCSIQELGFSYNGCGWKGSRAVASFLEAPQSSRLRVLYLNRQQGELDLQGILRAAAAKNVRVGGDDENLSPELHLNLSQNYVPSLETLRELREISESWSKESQGDDEPNPNTPGGFHVELDSMVFEVPEAEFPGNGSNQYHNSRANNNINNNARGNGDTKKKSFEEHRQNLSKEEIAKLNVACGRVKYVLGRTAAASDRENASLASTQSNPSRFGSGTSSSNNGGGSTGSDWYFSSMAALDCVLPDLLTILRLQEKQSAPPKPHETSETDDPKQHPQEHPQQNDHHPKRHYRNWLPTFLRKAVKGKVELLEPWLLSITQGTPQRRNGDEEEPFGTDGRKPPVVVTESEQDQLKALWNEIEALHTNIAQFAGHRRHKHSPGNHLGEESSTPDSKTKNSSRRKKHGRRGVSEIPMTPRDNPLVKAAYEAIPVIPTSILESSDDVSPFLSLPMETSDERIPKTPESNDSIVIEGNKDGLVNVRTVPPLFIDTAEGLLKLRDDQFRRPPPHKLPKMVAVDSEWYFTQNVTSGDGNGQPPSDNAHYTPNHGRPKKTKNRSMSVATLQIAYVDENKAPDMVLRSFVIDLLSNQSGFQEVAKEYVSWLFGSACCEMMVLGFAFGGDLRQLRKYAGIGGYKGHHHNQHHQNNNGKSDRSSVASLAAVESRCLDLQRLLSTPDDVRTGRVPGLKKCAQHYFSKPLKKDDQTSDWTERPLRRSQVEYAALDAVILLVLLSQKKHEDESRRQSNTTSVR